VDTPKDEPGRMTIREHLEELRSRLIGSILAILVGFVLAFWWRIELIEFLRVPLAGAADPEQLKMIQTKPHGAFLGMMKIAFFAGCVVAAPVIVHHLWSFVAAGLYRHERRTVKYYAVPGFLLFFAGCALAYLFVLPFAFNFLISFAENLKIESYLDVMDYVSFVAMMMFVFGLMFQLPMIMIFLMRLGVVEPATFAKYRRHAVVANFGIAMILTPPDVVSQIALAACMTLLYESAVLIGRRVAGERQEP